jgi:hypothetical protein
MTTWAQRRWEAEQHERFEACPDCERPILDRGHQYWPVACHCPRCDWCGARGATLDTAIAEDDEVCRTCRAAEAR